MLRAQKMTLGEMRASGVRGPLIYADYKCSHWTLISGDACDRLSEEFFRHHRDRPEATWPDEVRLSGLEPQFTCTACGKRGADVRLDFDWERKAGRQSDDRHSTRKIGPLWPPSATMADGRTTLLRSNEVEACLRGRVLAWFGDRNGDAYWRSCRQQLLQYGALDGLEVRLWAVAGLAWSDSGRCWSLR